MNENKWDTISRIFKGIQTDFKFMELDKEANLDRYNGDLPKWIQMSVNTVDSDIEVGLTKCKKYEYYGIFKIELGGNISFEEMDLHLPVMANTRFYARGVTTIITDPMKLAEKIVCPFLNEFSEKLNVGDSVDFKDGKVEIAEDYDNEYYYIKDNNTNVVKIKKVKDDENLIAYHGTKESNYQDILKNGFKGEKTFLSEDCYDAEGYGEYIIKINIKPLKLYYLSKEEINNCDYTKREGYDGIAYKFLEDSPYNYQIYNINKLNQCEREFYKKRTN